MQKRVAVIVTMMKSSTQPLSTSTKYFQFFLNFKLSGIVVVPCAQGQKYCYALPIKNAEL